MFNSDQYTYWYQLPSTEDVGYCFVKCTFAPFSRQASLGTDASAVTNTLAAIHTATNCVMVLELYA